MKKLALILSFLLAAPLVQAMEFKSTVTPKGVSVIYAFGDIVDGDNEKLRRHLAKLKGKDVVVLLDSDGGLVHEGMLMGLSIHEHGARTGIAHPTKKTGHCASACSLTFYGGHERYMTNGDKLGVHQMNFEDGKQDAASAQYWTSKIYEYADVVNMPKAVLHRKFKTRTETMYYFASHEYQTVGIKVLK